MPNTPIKAVLFDLDDTLVILDMDAFSAAYFQSLAARIAPLCPPEEFVPALQAGTQAMMSPDGSDPTNAATFERVFFSLVKRDPAPLRAAFDAFYREDFPRLARYSQADPVAGRLVSLLKGQGYQLALATQPLLPKIAIVERLRWAGVDPAHFDLIACYEEMRGSKPHPVFFQQVLERLGRAPTECLMVGDSPSADLPAKRLGIKTFWVNRGRGEAPTEDLPDAQGTLQDLLMLVERGGLDDL
ncbi:MAG: HAD family hydrolase [Chloroflexi bacterium]|nr:HAD family hydrolase [Chloroflexota bacterium]